MILRLPASKAALYFTSSDESRVQVQLQHLYAVCIVEFEEQVYVVDGRKRHGRLQLLAQPVTYGFPATRFPDVDTARFAIRLGYVPTEDS